MCLSVCMCVHVCECSHLCVHMWTPEVEFEYLHLLTLLIFLWDSLSVEPSVLDRLVCLESLTLSRPQFLRPSATAVDNATTCTQLVFLTIFIIFSRVHACMQCTLIITTPSHTILPTLPRSIPPPLHPIPTLCPSQTLVMSMVSSTGMCPTYQGYTLKEECFSPFKAISCQ